MLRDVSLITVVAAIIAIPFGLLADVDADLLVLYVLGCGALATLSSYFGFLTRIAGWHGIVHALFFGLLLLLCYGVAASVRQIDAISRLYTVLIALAVVAVTFRAVARHWLQSIDWCAVRPAKVVRAGLIR
jgi:hypothetical protein